MDYNEPIYAEIIEDEAEANRFRAYLITRGIDFEEEHEDHLTIDGVHIFKCYMNRDQLFEANVEIDAFFYQ